jgi:hypothetical protein
MSSASPMEALAAATGFDATLPSVVDHRLIDIHRVSPGDKPVLVKQDPRHGCSLAWCIRVAPAHCPDDGIRCRDVIGIQCALVNRSPDQFGHNVARRHGVDPNAIAGQGATQLHGQDAIERVRGLLQRHRRLFADAGVV